MPYNTRRKSLSLPSLGIHLPNTSRSHRSASTSKSSTNAETQPPSKKVKRQHDLESQSTSESISKIRISTEGQTGNITGAYDHTPPPSPGDTGIVAKIDTEGINDDIIVAVIEQLEKTGNRPHLIKELATVLSDANETIANSANAAALISSRLSLYLKRSWSALAPCPIAKEQIPVHPRRVFFYLTNSPAQPLPGDSSDIITPPATIKQITPSLSNGSDIGDVDDAFARSRMSPSPEIDLSSPVFEHEETETVTEHSIPPTPTGGYSMRSRMSHSYRLSHHHRAVSPPLEGDEKEFTLTASSVRERTSAEELVARPMDSPSSENDEGDSSESQPDANMEDCFISSESHSPSPDYTYFPSNDTRVESDITSADVEVLGTSPSPSMSSDLSSLSSASSTTSDESDSFTSKPVVSFAASLSSSEMEIAPSRKRSLDMMDTGFDHQFDLALDSWLDLQSPEAVEIHELDAIFADV